MSFLAKDPVYSKQILAAQQGKLKPENNSDVLDKAKTLEVFATSKEYSLDILKYQTSEEGKDDIEKVTNVLVDEAKLSDALFLEFGVTSEKLENSIMYYIAKNDTEIKSAMASFMREMQAE